MKNFFLKTKIAFAVLAITLTLSCNGDDGIDGLQGPAGPTGINGTEGTDGVDGANGTDGIDGTDGTNGTDGTDGTNGIDGADGTNGINGTNGTDGADGADGNANVIYSDWFTPSWTKTTDAFGRDLFEHDEAAADITQDILDSGVILVYGQLNGYNSDLWPTYQVGLLPLVITYNTDIDTWTLIFSVGNLRIRLINNNNSYSSLSILYQFRYIIIPSNNLANKSSSKSKQDIKDMLSNYGVDISNYDEVCDFYGIKSK